MNEREWKNTQKSRGRSDFQGCMTAQSRYTRRIVEVKSVVVGALYFVFVDIKKKEEEEI